MREILSLLAKPLQKHIAAERETRQREWLVRVLTEQSPHHTIEIRRLAGVVQPTRARHLAIARPKDQGIGGPAALVREREQPAQIMRSNCAFQPVKYEQTAAMRRACTARLESTQFDLVPIIHHPTFDTSLERWRATHELSPQGPQMCARYPPRGGVGILAGTAHVTGTGSKLGTGNRSIISSLHVWTFRSSE